MPHSSVQRTAVVSALLALLCASAYAQSAAPMQATGRGAPLPKPLLVPSNPVVDGQATLNNHMVVRKATQMTLDPKVMTFGHDIVTKGTFKVANQTTPNERLAIEYTLDGKHIPDQVANDDGTMMPYWSYQSHPEFTAGSHKLVATFTGNERLLGTTAETTINILKAKAIFLPFAHGFKHSWTPTGDASLANGYFELDPFLAMDSDTKVKLGGQPIDIYIANKKVATVTTKSDGIAHYEGPGIQTPVGKYSIEYRFNGNQNFMSLTSEPMTITIAPSKP